MMAHGRESALSIRQSDPDVLDHPLIFVIEYVAMQDEFADVALITRSSNHVVSRLTKIVSFQTPCRWAYCGSSDSPSTLTSSPLGLRIALIWNGFT